MSEFPALPAASIQCIQIPSPCRFPYSESLADLHENFCCILKSPLPNFKAIPFNLQLNNISRFTPAYTIFCCSNLIYLTVKVELLARFILTALLLGGSSNVNSLLYRADKQLQDVSLRRAQYSFLSLLLEALGPFQPKIGEGNNCCRTNLELYVKCRVGNPLFGFLSESLVICQQKREIVLHSLKRANRSCNSFLKSDGSDLLTVALFSKAIRRIRSQSLCF